MVHRKLPGAKVAFIILIAVFIIAAIFTIFPSSYNWVIQKTNRSSIVVTTHNGLNKKNVTIVWCPENRNCDTIYKNGAVAGKNFKQKGRNSFQIFYNDSLISIFSHEQTEGVEGVSYNVTVKEEFSKITAEVKIVE